MNKLYKKGDLLQITTKDEVIEGQFYTMSDDKSRISLGDTKRSSKGIPSDGILHYYRSEILDVLRLKATDEQKKYLKIAQNDLEDLIIASKKYIYIHKVDKTFHDAIMDLKDHSFIAVSTDGASMGRKSKMPFLVLSTPKQIYIFDTQVMQFHAFDAGLRDLLESKYPKKIIHDSRNLSDCLKHKHDVNLKSVFDTQVGDLIIRKNKNGVLPKDVKSLNDCLHDYLGLQKAKNNIINDMHDITQSSERPLSFMFKESLAMNITFLHPLSEAINDEMQLPFLKGAECYIESLRSHDSFIACSLIKKIDEIPQDFVSATGYS